MTVLGQWLCVYLAHSTAILAVTWAVSARARCPDRESVWRAAVLAPLLSATVVSTSGHHLWTVRVAVSPAVGNIVAGQALFPGWLDLMTIVWLTVGSLLLARDLIGRWVFITGLGPRTAVAGEAASQFHRLRAMANLPPSVRLTMSTSLSSPVTLTRSEICIPSRALRDLPEIELRAAFAHELAHVVRRDPAWMRAMGALESALFLQPLHRVVRRRLQRFAEEACDRWAADRVGDPRAMASCLVSVSSWAREMPPKTSPGMLGTTSLSRRVARLLEPTWRAPSPYPIALTLPVFLLSAVLIPDVNVRFSHRASVNAVMVDTSGRSGPAGNGGAPSAYDLGFELGRRFREQRHDASQPAEVRKDIERGRQDGRAASMSLASRGTSHR